MDVRKFLGLTGVLAILGGLPFLLIPEQANALFGLVTDDAGTLITRYFGGSFMSFGILIWFVRDAIDADEHRTIFVPMMICGFLGAGVGLIGQLSGLANAWGWLPVVLFSVIGLGFGWYSRK